jgi:hypothetical protein
LKAVADSGSASHKELHDFLLSTFNRGASDGQVDDQFSDWQGDFGQFFVTYIIAQLAHTLGPLFQQLI